MYFSDHDLTNIKSLYSRLFSVPLVSLIVMTTYMQYSTMKIKDKQIGTFSSMSSNASIVLALWIPVLTSSGVSGEPENDQYVLTSLLSTQFKLVMCST